MKLDIPGQRAAIGLLIPICFHLCVEARMGIENSFIPLHTESDWRQESF